MRWENFGAFLGKSVCWDGLSLGFFAVGKASMMGRWKFGMLSILLLGRYRCGVDCLFGFLGCMACGPSEHVALQEAWGLLGV